MTDAALFHRYANPARFRRLVDPVIPWTAGASVVLILIGLYLALVASPADWQQGDTVRIMYVHVPAAWVALFAYVGMAVASAIGLVWRHPLAEVFTKSAAPVGAAFTLLCLVTGSIWGKPMWGTWWVWDARLTSVLILFFLYIGYIALVNAFDSPDRGLKAGAILVIVGAVNIPIIRFSVDWWNTLHQPASVFRMEGPTIHPDMLWPLAIMSLGFMAYFAVVVILRMSAELIDRRIRSLQQLEAQG